MQPDPRKLGRNRVLSALPAAALQAVARDLRILELPVRQTVFEKGKPFQWVYFMLTGVVSMVASAGASEQVEVATVGNEGMAGLPAFLGSKTSAMTSFVQVPGWAARMRMADFRKHLEEVDALAQMLSRYTQAFITQIAQGCACNRLHPVQARCARWMLTTHDRVEGDEFTLSQEFLAQMLGVRRASVTLAAGALQREGMIRYRRSRMSVVDRSALEAASCECYAIVESEYLRLIGAPRHRAKK